MSKLKVTFSDNTIMRVKAYTLTATTLFYRRRDDTSLFMVVAEERVPPVEPKMGLPMPVQKSLVPAVNLMTGELLTIGADTLVYLATGELVAQARGVIS